jgi:hypothetical protein
MSWVGPRTGAGRGEGRKYAPRARVTAGPPRAKPAPPRPVTNTNCNQYRLLEGFIVLCIVSGYELRRFVSLVIVVISGYKLRSFVSPMLCFS